MKPFARLLLVTPALPRVIPAAASNACRVPSADCDPSFAGEYSKP
jgi:hypothetical protein